MNLSLLDCSTSAFLWFRLRNRPTALEIAFSSTPFAEGYIVRFSNSGYLQFLDCICRRCHLLSSQNKEQSQHLELQKIDPFCSLFFSLCSRLFDCSHISGMSLNLTVKYRLSQTRVPILETATFMELKQEISVPSAGIGMIALEIFEYTPRTAAHCSGLERKVKR